MPVSAVSINARPTGIAPRASIAPHRVRPLVMIAQRELRLVWRGRAARLAALLFAVAWLPPLLVALRSGSLGIASFRQTLMIWLALDEVMLPLMALMVGADLIAGEIEDGTLVPILTMPLSRTACFFGKWLGRVAMLATAYVAAFGSIGLVVAAMRGTAGWQDYAVLATAGLLLVLACVAIGCALGTLGRARTRAFGSAIIAWLVMVFALDAILLGAAIAINPPPPEAVGTHGYSELSAQMETMKLHQLDEDPHEHHAGMVESTSAASGAAVWLMAMNPVDLFRISALTMGPELRERTAIEIGGTEFELLPLAFGWIFWIAFPLALAVRRFGRTILQ
jgi:Cu-processing system permease protein